MSNQHKVVAFSRTPEYMHHRAMMNRQDNNALDAVELMRRAMEESPENREYKLDLAELYCEMGCHNQSMRLLFDMLADDGGPAECYYGLALNELGLNHTAQANKYLELYRNNDPEGEHIQSAEQLEADMDLSEQLNRPANRKMGRAIKLSDMACEAMKADLPHKARRLFERALALAPDMREMRALYAMSLYMTGDNSLAQEQALLAVHGNTQSVRAMCVSAQVLNLLGECNEAQTLIRKCIEEHPSGYELRLLIFSLGQMQLHSLVAEQSRLALQEAPYDCTLLHTRAIALKKCGESNATVGRIWSRILRIDPRDSVALFYHNAANDGTLDNYTLDYNYEVPREEYARRVFKLVRIMENDTDVIKQHWAESDENRELICWAAKSQEMRLARTAITLLSVVEANEADSVLREVLFRSDTPMPLKFHIALLFQARDSSSHSIFPEEMSVAAGALPEPETMLAQMPIGERGLVRFAAEILESEYGYPSLMMPALVWMAYRAVIKTHADPLNETQTAAAALCYHCLLLYGERISLREVAKAFSCPMRRMVFYARRISGSLEKMGEHISHENL